MFDTVTAICATTPPIDTAQTVDRKRHGRQEHRHVETFNIAGRLGPEWDGRITTAVRVSRLTWRKDTKSGYWRPTEEVALYACQAALAADQADTAIRAHWAIENRQHHVRDVSLFEDHSRIRIAPGIFARMRSFAINILRANAVANISRELYINALDPLHPLAHPIT